MNRAEARVKFLTKRTVDAARPEAVRYVLWDDKLKGFGLRVQPAAGKSPALKTFIVRYRAGGGRAGKLYQKTLGRHGTVTADQARSAAKKLLGAASAGGDPLGDRKRAQQAGLTVNEVCEWYFQEVDSGRLLGRRGRPIKASTTISDKSRFNVHVRPLIGSRIASSLQLKDLEEMQSAIATGKTAAKTTANRARGGVARGGGGAGRRTLAMLNSIFEHAARRTIITANPARGARKLAPTRRTRRLSLDELRAFGAALQASGETQTAKTALRLIAITGFRRNEALALRPEWLIDAGGVNFPDTKTGPQIRPIGKAAVTLIKKQIGSTEWVFPAERGGGHFVGLPKVLARICKAAKLSDVTIHVFRHSFASVAGDLGYSEFVIAGLLGHSAGAGSVTGGYVHLDKALVSAADHTASVILASLDGKQTGAVVRLRASG